MKLSKMLKLKNRLAGELTRLKEMVPGINIVEDGRTHEYNITDIWVMVERRAMELALLKACIANSNSGILAESDGIVKKSQWFRIFHVAEIKGMIDTLKTIRVKNGTFQESTGYGAPVIERNFESELRQQDLDLMRSVLEQKIDQYQEEIDEYNATVFCSIVDSITI